MPTLSEALAIAVDHHRSGRIAAAEEIYRQILAVTPDEPNTLNLLGVLARDAGRLDVALDYLQRAIRVDDTQAVFHNNLGNVLRELGKDVEAIDCFRRAVQLNLHYPKALFNMAIALQSQGRFEEAVGACERASAMLPDNAEAHNQLADALKAAGRSEEALDHYRQAVGFEPVNFVWQHNLGNALRDLGRPHEAIACYRRVLVLKPDFAEAHGNLGIALKDLDRLDEAVASYRRALELKPRDAQTNSYLGNALMAQGKLDEAVACHQRALVLNFNDAVSHNNLSVALKSQGRLLESIRSCQKALELDPTMVEAHSNWLYTLYFSPDYDAQAIYREHRRWNEKFARPLMTDHRSSNHRSSNHRSSNHRPPATDHRLRVGYVSPDFRLHPVGRFIAPLLEAHDHGLFEIFAYSSVRNEDEFTHRCRSYVDSWRDVVTLSDEQLAQTIRNDEIDILVDLTMHLEKNRLLVFARKPAPVQVTYLAYCGTTGMDAIDYRLTDPYLDPPPLDETANETIYSERSIHLPESYWCYRPAIEALAVGPLPAETSGCITFACLNNFCKITEPTLAAWSRILLEVPSSRLLLHAFGGSHRGRVWDFFRSQGIVRERVEFVSFMPLAEFYRIHAHIDIALDPFPYGGGTTTCDALWMGVPVVSLVGQSAVGRGGLSILSNIGLPHLAARDVDRYVALAVGLANDHAQLIDLRRTLRDRMLHSPLMDAARFASHVEIGYRRMWQESS